MSDLYQLLNVSGVKQDNNQIVKLLQDICSGKLTNDLRLLNYFNEVPVSYPGVVENVEDDMVDISTNQHQVVVMNHEKMTFLKSRHFPHDVIAKVFRADVGKSLAILSRFSYAQIRAERRECVRVKLDGKIPVSFFTGSSQLRGGIENISISGMCVWAEPTNAIELQANGVLTVVLDKVSLEIPAILLKIFEEEGRTKYIFNLEADSRIEQKISHFIFQRQLEIIRELNETI